MKKGSGKKSVIKQGDIQVYLMNLIDDCRLDDCHASHVCQYHKEMSMAGKKCMVMHWYMQQASQELFKDSERMGRLRTFQVGMHILPMYRSICKLQIAEAGLDDGIYLNSRGEVTVNQIYKHLLALHDGTLKMWGRIFRANSPSAGTLPGLKPDFEIPTHAPGKRKKK